MTEGDGLVQAPLGCGDTERLIGNDAMNGIDNENSGGGHSRANSQPRKTWVGWMDSREIFGEIRYFTSLECTSYRPGI